MKSLEMIDQIVTKLINSNDRLKTKISVQNDFIIFGPGSLADSLTMSGFLIDLEQELKKMKLIEQDFLDIDFFEKNKNKFKSYFAIRDLILAI